MEKKSDKLAKANESDIKKVALKADFGELYIKVKQDGQIMRPVRAQMCLFKKLGHFYKIKDDYAISHPGYKYLNKVASISIVTPQMVIVDGREQHNPHIERNERTKMIESVFIRKIGIGFSPIGNVTVVDKTLLYNIYTYFIESVQSKMKKVEWKNNKPTDIKLHPNCAVFGIEKEKPEEEGKWAFFETTSPLGLWINYEDPATIDCLNEHTQRQRFGERIAQTIVERNILKDHPAIGVGKVQPQATKEKDRAYVTVYGYRHDFGPAQINEILEQAERGSETIEVKAEIIDTVNHEEEEQIVKETAKEEKTPAEMDKPPEDFVLTPEEPEKEGE